MHDPEGEPNNKTTVATIQTRADHGNSEDGVLGMSAREGLRPRPIPAKRDLYVYYSPRNPAWPTTGDQIVVGYNQISRFTLNAEGTAVVPGSERVILRVPKAKISGNPSGFPGGPTDSGPGHVGGAGLDFDSEGNLYLGVGDDVSPNAPGHDALPADGLPRRGALGRAQDVGQHAPTCAARSCASSRSTTSRPDAQPGAGTTYSIPAGNMFAPGTAQTRPEIYAMGFRQPFTVQTDPAQPGHVVVGEYCHDNSLQRRAARARPACASGTCSTSRLPRAGRSASATTRRSNTTFRWNYAANATTGQQYDCSQSVAAVRP